MLLHSLNDSYFQPFLPDSFGDIGEDTRLNVDPCVGRRKRAAVLLKGECEKTPIASEREYRVSGLFKLAGSPEMLEAWNLALETGSVRLDRGQDWYSVSLGKVPEAARRKGDLMLARMAHVDRADELSEVDCDKIRLHLSHFVFDLLEGSGLIVDGDRAFGSTGPEGEKAFDSLDEFLSGFGGALDSRWNISINELARQAGCGVI